MGNNGDFGDSGDALHRYRWYLGEYVCTYVQHVAIPGTGRCCGDNDIHRAPFPSFDVLKSLGQGQGPLTWLSRRQVWGSGELRMFIYAGFPDLISSLQSINQSQSSFI